MAETLNIAEERLKLYELQRSRVDLDHSIELRLKKTFPSLTQDVRVMKELLDDLEDDQRNRKVSDSKPSHLSV